MAKLSPTSNQRLFLRAIAAFNPEDREGWWASADIRATFPADFRGRTVQSISATGRQCVAQGYAESRTVGPLRHCWTEYRIRALGRGLISDSCIGGGLKWARIDRVPRCPACLATPADLAAAATPAELAAAGAKVVRGVPEIPAHPLPGHFPLSQTG
jgi:hypothetical protein